MPNLYGVANAPGLPVWVQYTSGVDINCPVGANTAIWTTPNLVAPSQGYFYAMAWYGMDVSFGATPPTGMNCLIGIGAGTAVNALSIPVLGVAASGTNFYYLTNFTPPSQIAWQGAGSPVVVYVAVAGQPVTVRAFSSGFVALFRAPDQ